MGCLRSTPPGTDSLIGSVIVGREPSRMVFDSDWVVATSFYPRSHYHLETGIPLPVAVAAIRAALQKISPAHNDFGVHLAEEASGWTVIVLEDFLVPQPRVEPSQRSGGVPSPLHRGLAVLSS